MFASQFCEEAIKAIQTRAAQRDLPTGERSMGRAVAMFSALTGIPLTETDGWKFMVCLKMARSQQGEYRQDDYVDMVGYAALAGECESLSSHNEF